MRHVVQLVTRLNVGGVSQHVAALATGLVSHGWQVTVVHGAVEHDESDASDALRQSGVCTVRVPALRRAVSPFMDMAATIALTSVLRSQRPEVVHTHMSKAGALGWLAARVRLPFESRPCTVHTFHGHVLDGYFDSGTSRLIAAVERHLRSRTDRNVVLSDRLWRELVEERQVVPAHRARLIRLGVSRAESVDRSRARAVLGVPTDSVVFGYVGRLARVKNPLLLIDAFARVASERATVRLLIAGDGNLREAVSARAGALGLQDRIRLLGTRSDVSTVYEAIDALVVSSDREGTPVSVLEAMSFGRAVVATNVGGVGDLVVDGLTGLLAPAGDELALAAAMRVIAASPTEAARMGLAGQSRVRLRHGLSHMIDSHAALYEELVQSADRGKHRTSEPR